MHIYPFFPAARQPTETFAEGKFCFFLRGSQWGPFPEDQLELSQEAQKTYKVSSTVFFSTGYKRPPRSAIVSIQTLANMIKANRPLLGYPFSEEMKKHFQKYFAAHQISGNAPISPSVLETTELLSGAPAEGAKKAVFIIGGMCAGKSTLAKKIQAAVNRSLRYSIPIVDADHFRPPTPAPPPAAAAAAGAASPPLDPDIQEQCLVRSHTVQQNLIENNLPLIRMSTGRDFPFVEKEITSLERKEYNVLVIQVVTTNYETPVDRAAKRTEQPVQGRDSTIRSSDRRSKLTAKGLREANRDVWEVNTEEENWEDIIPSIVSFFEDERGRKRVRRELFKPI